MHPQHRKGPWRNYTDEYKAGETLYKENCASCHGGHGEGNNETSTPKLYGQHYPYIKRQIKLVKSGLRTVNSAMQTVAQQLTDEQLERIINYISYLPVPEDERAPSLNWRNTDFN
jgi:cytochrome c553